jgi:glyoxylase-like metal-dependent hydrolase (beta-lactamase superfamily II)
VQRNSAAPVSHIGIPNPMFEGELNLYVIAGDPLTLVDTGIGTPEALAALEKGLADLGLSLDAVRQVVLTHKHADHIGLAADIRDRSGATVYIHEDDWEGVANLDARHEEFVPLVLRRLRQFHVPEEEIEKLHKGLGQNQRFARETPCQKLRHGDRLSISGVDLEVIHTPGHTQGSICLKYAHHLFSGDHVLPTISPNIGAGEMRRSGMMRRFLDSLDRIAQYQADDVVVLPGHGRPFSNLAERVGELKNHHAERERAILDVLAGGEAKTVYEVARGLWPRLPGYHLSLGTNEVNAHLEKLVEDGTVRQEDGRFSLATAR